MRPRISWRDANQLTARFNSETAFGCDKICATAASLTDTFITPPRFSAFVRCPSLRHRTHSKCTWDCFTGLSFISLLVGEPAGQCHFTNTCLLRSGRTQGEQQLAICAIPGAKQAVLSTSHNQFAIVGDGRRLHE